MQTLMSQNRHLILLTLFLALLLTLFYIYQPVDHSTSLSQNKASSAEDKVVVNEATQEKQQAPKKEVTVKKPKKTYSVCDKVDFAWLASDRKYWDGWTDKSMFMKADGTFTKGNVYINEGEEICIVVLLGPTPAQGSIKDEDHVGPKDSIVMFANGENTAKLSIQLQQSDDSPNAYFAQVKFQQADTYRLNAITEYRSYFWETPILHSYQPHDFKSQNKLVVRPKSTTAAVVPPAVAKLPLCDLKSNKSLLNEFRGTWVDKVSFESSGHGQQLFTTYENTEKLYSINDKVFIPDTCQLEYKSDGQGAKCLGKKTVHVIGDNNVRRNLKALKSGNNWCNLDEIRKIENKKERNEKLRCGCNDDHEDNTAYPWVNDPFAPLKLSNSWDVDSKIYFNNIGESIVNHQSFIQGRISDFVKNETVPTADMVIIGLGSGDVEAIQASPKQFALAYKDFLAWLRKDIYPHQKLIIRTPQYFCCGNIWATSWNTGRSLAFTMIVRDTIKSFHDSDMMLWDVHSIGTDDTACLNYGGSSYSKRNMVNLENLLLWNMIC